VVLQTSEKLNSCMITMSQWWCLSDRVDDLFTISKHKIQDISVMCGKVYKLLKTRFNHAGEKGVANVIAGRGK